VCKLNPTPLSARQLRCLSALAFVTTLACHRGSPQDIAPISGRRVTDGDIVAIILAANNTDISYARLVAGRARSADVKTFAQRMLTDHTILNTRVNDIAMRNGITAVENPTSLDFRDRSANRRDILRELDGVPFDSAYAANEVQYHTELLSALNSVLVPNMRNSELREFVNVLKPAVSAHLAHAEQVRAAVAARK
jgi:putative membrane protein